MSIVAMRSKLNTLITRYTACKYAFEDLMRVMCPYTDLMANMRNAREEWDEDGIRDPVEGIDENVGAMMPVMSLPILDSMFEDRVYASNILSEIREIEQECKGTYVIDPNTVEPSTDGWSPSEILAIENSYKAKFAHMTGLLDTIHKNATKILGVTHHWVESSVICLEPARGVVQALNNLCDNSKR